MQDVLLAPALLELAILDALGYNTETDEGGQDGSILFELTDNSSKYLVKASDTLQTIKKELLRTNTVSYSDLVAFGGGEALETVGCGRVTVQVGRFDAKTANKLLQSTELSTSSASDIKSSFLRSGLTAQQIALLLGALGEVNRIASETYTAQQNAVSNNDDDDEDEQPFVPTTFGARDAIYGAKMGKADFGVTYLKSILKAKNQQESPLAKCLTENPDVKFFAQKYAQSEAAFVKDVPEAYLRLTLLGEAYTTRNS